MPVNLADYARPHLRELLSQCTEEQQAFFHRIFTDGIDALNEERIKTAIGLVQRTIKKNSEPAS